MKIAKIKIIGLLSIFSVINTITMEQNPINFIEQEWYNSCQAYREGLISAPKLISILRNAVTQSLFMLEQQFDEYSFMLARLRTADYIGMNNLYDELVGNIIGDLWIKSNRSGKLYRNAYNMIKRYIVSSYHSLQEAKTSGHAKSPKVS